MLANEAARLEQSDDIAKLWDGLIEILRPVGIEFVIYITVDADFEQPLLMTNAGEVYRETDPKSDPFLSHCCRSYETTLTGPDYLSDYEYLAPDDRAFISRASRTGFRSGIAIPMRLTNSMRFGGFNLGTRMDRDTFEERILPLKEDLRFLCLLCHRRFEELSGENAALLAEGEFRDLLVAPVPRSLSALSPREREVIYLVAQGISRKECARLCGITANTVAEYTKSAYRKLGVQNRVEATRIVLNGGDAA